MYKYQKLHSQLPRAAWLTTAQIYEKLRPDWLSISWEMDSRMTHLFKKKLVNRRLNADGVTEWQKVIL